MLKQLSHRKKTKFLSNILKSRKYKKLQTSLADNDVLLKADVVGQSPPGRSIDVLSCEPDYEAQFVFQRYNRSTNNDDPSELTYVKNGDITDGTNNNNKDFIKGGQLPRRKKMKLLSNILKSRKKYTKLRTSLADKDILVKTDVIGQPPPGRSIEVLSCDPDYEAQFVFQRYNRSTNREEPPDATNFQCDDITDGVNSNDTDFVEGGKNVKFASTKEVGEFGSEGIDITVIDEDVRVAKKRKSVKKRAKRGLYRVASYTWTGLKAVFTGMSLVASNGTLSFNLPKAFQN